MKIPEITITVKYKNKVKHDELVTIRKSSEAAAAFRTLFNSDQILWVEEFIMICCNAGMKVIGYYKVSKGGTGMTCADPRVIALLALQSCASNVYIAHNHPSGNLKPSEADKSLTMRVKDGLELFNIRLLDHLILSDENHFSFSDEGLL